jgi:hypothetical protein
MNQPLYVECECTNKRPVTPAQCGTTIQCLCGRTINVPRLSEVRRNCGQSNLSTIERMRQMIHDNELPSDPLCSVCRSKNGAVIQCTVQCETYSVAGPGYWGAFFGMLFSPLQLFFGSTSWLGYRNAEVHGRNTAVTVPISVCDQCDRRFRKSDSERKLAMRGTTLYASLLDDYPDAITVIAGQ